MSRLENNKFDINPEKVELRTIITEISEIMEFQIEQKNLKLKVVIDSSVPHFLLLDQKRYKQVLFNLLGNAIKFTMKGYIKIMVKFVDDCLITEVEDTGIGIKTEDQEKLFKFFGKL